MFKIPAAATRIPTDWKTNYYERAGESLIALKQYKKAKKKDIRKLLWDKLPNILSDAQKENKIHNLLASLKKQGIIGKDSENQ